LFNNLLRALASVSELNADFIDYVQFRPDAGTAEENIFVTLGKVVWSMHGKYDWGLDYTLINSCPNPASTSSDEFPVWTGQIND
jgi:hypothetical protein